jgi:hypothetical protein
MKGLLFLKEANSQVVRAPQEILATTTQRCEGVHEDFSFVITLCLCAFLVNSFFVRGTL